MNQTINMTTAMTAPTTITDTNNVQYIFTIPNGMQTQAGIPVQLQGLQGLQGLQNAQIIQLPGNGQTVQPTIISLMNNQ